MYENKNAFSDNISPHGTMALCDNFWIYQSNPPRLCKHYSTLHFLPRVNNYTLELLQLFEVIFQQLTNFLSDNNECSNSWLGPAPSFLTNVKLRRLDLWTGQNGMMRFIKEHSYFNKHVLLQKKSRYHTIEGFYAKLRSVLKWYFFYQICSGLLWEKIVLVGWRPRICKIFEITENNFRTNFGNRMLLTCSWRFLIPSKLEKLEWKLEWKYLDLETCRKS